MVDRETFKCQFFHQLLRDCHSYQANNSRDADYLMFGRGGAQRRICGCFKDVFRLAAARLGYSRRRFNLDKSSEEILWVLENLCALENTFEMLGDRPSRQLLVTLAVYRVLGSGHVKLPRNEPEYWKLCRLVERRFLREARAILAEDGMPLDRYEVPGENGPIRLYARASGILNTFLLHQYAYVGVGRRVVVKAGDIVLDGGSCWGDTALYFADKVGPGGKVYCFEFCPGNLGILERNLALNPHLAPRIRVIPRALWCHSEEVLGYFPSGPGTSVVRKDKPQTLYVSTVSVDQFLQEEGLPRVDFIKLDVEGSELAVLQGAESTLRAFAPSLAIALYHKKEDLVTIPRYLNDLGVAYNFFLDHFTIHQWETVLYACN